MFISLRDKLIGKYQSIFEFAWGLWIFSRVLIEGNTEELSWFWIIKTLLMGGSVALALGVAFLHHRTATWRAYIAWTVVLLLAVSVKFTEGSWVLLNAALIIFATWWGRFDYRKLFDVAVWAMSLGAIVVVGLAAFGVISKGFIGIDGSRLRSSFGFQWPSRLPNILLTIIMAYVCGHRSIKPAHAAVFGAFALLIYCDTGSRAPFLCAIAILVGALVVERIPRIGDRWLPWACLGFLAVAFFGTFWLAASYDPETPWMASLNRAMSNRLLYSHNAFVSTGILPFGSSLFTGDGVSPSTVGYLDAGYLSLFFSYGWVFGIIFMLSFGCLVFWAAKSHSWVMVICLLLIIIQGTVESKILALHFTPFLLLLPDAVGCIWEAIAARNSRPMKEDPLLINEN